MIDRLRLSLGLLVGRRLVILAAVDGVLLLFAFIIGLTAGEAFDPWVVVILPALLLGLPVLSDVVALERRAGSLDLALSSPGAARYFERRIGAFWTVLTVQGALSLLLFRLNSTPYDFQLAPALLKTALFHALLGAVSLFWAVRLHNPGAVLFASGLTTTLLAAWVFPSPIYRVSAIGPYLKLEDVLDWSHQIAVLGTATAVLYLYAKRRLDRPETLLT